MALDDAYANNHVDFAISNIEWEDDARISPTTIDGFEYSAPAISVDTKGRFATHEIIGGTTVRQKIGEDPIEVSVSGVCRQSIAKKLDALRDAKWGYITTTRLPGNSLDVQFASVSTSPMSDSGAVGYTDDDAEFLYTFDLSMVEVNLPEGAT